MTASTLDASMIRLEGIKENKHLYNKSKIAEAEALAAEALRMANEAKLAAARLAEVKRTLSLFSKKLEKVERTVQKENVVVDAPIVEEPVEDISKEPPVEEPIQEKCVNEEEPIKEEPTTVETTVEEPVVEESPVVVERVKEEPTNDEPAIAETTVEEVVVEDFPVVVETVESAVPEVHGEEEPTKEKEDAPVVVVEEYRPDPIENTGIVSRNLVGNDVVKVVETGNQIASRDAIPTVQNREFVPKATVNAIGDVSSNGQESHKDLLEGALDSIGIDRMCGVDDETLGFVASDIVVPAHYKQFQQAAFAVTKQPVSIPDVQFIETKQSLPPQVDVVRSADTSNAIRVAPAPVVTHSPADVQNKVADFEKDIIEDFLDSLGIDTVCGVDDKTLGFTDRPQLPPPPPPVVLVTPFENPTRVVVKPEELTQQEMLHSASWKEKIATNQRQQRNLKPRTYQRAPVNSDFTDPFGVDHDDLVFCGKLADLCEPPNYDGEFDDDRYYAPQQYDIRPDAPVNNQRKNVSFRKE